MSASEQSLINVSALSVSPAKVKILLQTHRHTHTQYKPTISVLLVDRPFLFVCFLLKVANQTTNPLTTLVHNCDSHKVQ